MYEGEPLIIVRASVRDIGNWGLPNQIALTVRTIDGEEYDAIINVSDWDRPKRQIEEGEAR